MNSLNMPYRCPQCGSVEPFYVSRVVLYDDILVTQDGVDYWSDGHHCEIPDGATISCCSCGNSGSAAEWICLGQDGE